VESPIAADHSCNCVTNGLSVIAANFITQLEATTSSSHEIAKNNINPIIGNNFPFYF
jgi:hypothetical protein